jgi:hypothetical protein
LAGSRSGPAARALLSPSAATAGTGWGSVIGWGGELAEHSLDEDLTVKHEAVWITAWET